jgi:hypothetical protein
MTEISPMQLGIAGGLIAVVLKVVLDFLRDILNKNSKDEARDQAREDARRAELDSIRRDFRDEFRKMEEATSTQVKEILASVTDLTIKAGNLMGQVEASQRRDERFHEKEWPTFVNSMHVISRRIALVEERTSALRASMGMSPTPADGIRIVTGIPIPIPVNDDGK